LQLRLEQVKALMPANLRNWFLAHPESVGESYVQHLTVASRFGLSMVAGGLGCLVHAIFPALFERTGSGAVKKLYGEMLARQPGAPRPAHEEPEWQLEYEI
jgi:hypothetical protein